MQTTFEPWRTAFRAFLPALPTNGLEFLLQALRTDDPELIQETTVAEDRDNPGAIAGACAIGFVAWRGLRLWTPGMVERQFGRWCQEADDRMGGVFCPTDEFTDWFDRTPRHVAFAALAVEVAAELERREAEDAAAEPVCAAA